MIQTRHLKDSCIMRYFISLTNKGKMEQETMDAITYKMTRSSTFHPVIFLQDDPVSSASDTFFDLLQKIESLRGIFHPTLFFNVSVSQTRSHYAELMNLSTLRGIHLFMLLNLTGNQKGNRIIINEAANLLKTYAFRQWLGFSLTLTKDQITSAIAAVEYANNLANDSELSFRYGKIPLILDFPLLKSALPKVDDIVAFYRRLSITEYKYVRPFFQAECRFPLTSLSKASCGIGRTTIAIDSMGKVYPCFAALDGFDSTIKVEDLSSFEEVGKTFTRMIERDVRSCAQCEAKPFCGSCIYPNPFDAEELCRLVKSIVWG